MYTLLLLYIFYTHISYYHTILSVRIIYIYIYMYIYIIIIVIYIYIYPLLLLYIFYTHIPYYHIIYIIYIHIYYIYDIYIKKSNVKRQSNTSNKEFVPNGTRKISLHGYDRRSNQLTISTHPTWT